jgi:hypothetical protein
MTDRSASHPPEPEQATEPEPERGSLKAPLLCILTPGATDEEVAALVAVVSAMAAGGAEERTGGPTPVWSAPARRVRTTLRHGSGAWRASGLP